jgi:hypothetical protein
VTINVASLFDISSAISFDLGHRRGLQSFRSMIHLNTQSAGCLGNFNLLRINQRTQLSVAKYNQRKRFVSPGKRCKISKNSRVLVGFHATPNIDLTTLHMNLANTQVKRICLTSSGCPQRAHCPFEGPLRYQLWTCNTV